jgi:transposase
MLIAPTILAELGDARRFANGDAVVRHTGLDVTAQSSDSKRSPGHLSRQGPRCCAGRCLRPPTASARPTSPDHDLYTQVKTRVDGNRAALTVARKLARRVRHTLIGLGDAALAPVPDLPLPMPVAA